MPWADVPYWCRSCGRTETARAYLPPYLVAPTVPMHVDWCGACEPSRPFQLGVSLRGAQPVDWIQYVPKEDTP